ncbi:MAG: hypothetical protein SGBAC_011994, partial [Bacillariaceae sp.]
MITPGSSRMLLLSVVTAIVRLLLCLPVTSALSQCVSRAAAAAFAPEFGAVIPTTPAYHIKIEPRPRSHNPKGFQNPRHNLQAQKELIKLIENAKDCRSLGDVIRNSNFLFHSNYAIKALVERLVELKPNMGSRDISGLLNVLSKSRVPKSSKSVHMKLMSNIAELSLSKFDLFQARDISMMLNALARRNIDNHRVFVEAGDLAVLKMDEFNPLDIAQMMNAF